MDADVENKSQIPLLALMNRLRYVSDRDDTAPGFSFVFIS